MQTLELVTSPYIDRIAVYHDIALRANAGAMQELAEHIGGRLANEQRILVVGAGQVPSIDGQYISSQNGHVPVRRSSDIVVQLGSDDPCFRTRDEGYIADNAGDTITTSVAQVLSDRRRVRQNNIMNRLGIGLLLAGPAIMASTEGVGHISGAAGMVGGLALLAFGGRRGQGKLPNLTGFESPVEITPLSHA